MHRIEPGSSSCSCPLMGHCDKPGTGGERINKVGGLTWPDERYFPYEILIFLCPEPIGFEPAQHVGCSLDWIHARESGDLGRLPLRHGDERADLCATGGSAGA